MSTRPRPFGLTDRQLNAVMVAASALPSEKRTLLFERVAARLRLHTGRHSDADVEDAVQRALHGLLQGAA